MEANQSTLSVYDTVFYYYSMFVASQHHFYSAVVFSGHPRAKYLSTASDPSIHYHATTTDDQNVKQDWQTALHQYITDIVQGRVAAVEISSAAGLRSAIILATETLPIQQRPLCADAGSFVKRVGQSGGHFWDKHQRAGQHESIISFTVSAPSSFSHVDMGLNLSPHVRCRCCDR
jgi:hypothetical protein